MPRRSSDTEPAPRWRMGALRGCAGNAAGLHAAVRFRVWASAAATRPSAGSAAQGRCAMRHAFDAKRFPVRPPRTVPETSARTVMPAPFASAMHGAG
ncbi:MAG: hypothetical protein D6725_17370, partial [Planctomycetota bacterium]